MDDQQTIILSKTHAHIMLAQLNIEDGLKAYDNKEDKVILKEVKQLFTQEALMPFIR